MTSRPPMVCGNFDERYFGRHLADPNEAEPGFCMCGLELGARVHTATSADVAEEPACPSL